MKISKTGSFLADTKLLNVNTGGWAPPDIRNEKGIILLEYNLKTNQIDTLNIALPPSSRVKEIEAKTYEILLELFSNNLLSHNL